MKTLIVEDEFTSRKILVNYLKALGETDVAVNGTEAVKAFDEALSNGAPYDLICLDIMMPDKDGQSVLKEIRGIEEKKGIGGLNGVKVIMTTALGDKKNVLEAFRGGCEAYLVKPIEKQKLLAHVSELGLLKKAA